MEDRRKIKKYITKLLITYKPVVTERDVILYCIKNRNKLRSTTVYNSVHKLIEKYSIEEHHIYNYKSIDQLKEYMKFVKNAKTKLQWD